MVKQFTIPCQFDGGQTSPVTLYIGHPEFTHHPVQFQSDWLGTAKGGTIPQDLMDTLQKLHDLANENGADFEELCYYALISATQHGTDGGASPENIHKYADEFIRQEGNVSTEETQGQSQSDNGASDAKNDTSSSAKEPKDVEPVNTEQKTQTESKEQSDDKNNQTPQQHVAPTIGTINQTSNATQSGATNSNNSNDIDLLGDDLSTETSSGSSSVSGSSNSMGDTGYSQEDEDLLLMDDDE